MSLILDALSRAERDRRAAEGVPDLLSPAETPPLRHRRRWIVFAALCAAALGIYLLSQLLRGPPAPESAPPRDPNAPEPAAAPVAAPAAAPPRQSVAAARPAPAAAKQPDPQPAAGDSAAIAALYSGAAESVQESAPASAPSAEPGPQVAAQRDATAAGPATENRVRESESQPSTTSETPLDLEELLRGARRAQADTGLSEHPVPLLDTLSQQYRDRVPTLMYLRHEYAGDGSTSSVVINGDTLREGQRSGAVQVVEILADSVILRFDGRDFRLRALNSWVNL